MAVIQTGSVAFASGTPPHVVEGTVKRLEIKLAGRPPRLTGDCRRRKKRLRKKLWKKDGLNLFFRTVGGTVFFAPDLAHAAGDEGVWYSYKHQPAKVFLRPGQLYAICPHCGGEWDGSKGPQRHEPVSEHIDPGPLRCPHCKGAIELFMDATP